MGDAKKSNRKPVSLNDSHYRLLQEFSAPPKSKPRPSTSSDDEEDNSCKIKPEPRRPVVDDDNENEIPKFFGNTDFDSSSEEKKPSKVKIEGRRRLCKVSSRDKENAGTGVAAAVISEPSFSDITDFDSPMPSNNVAVSKGNQGADEIRDILTDLSSRLGLLTIEKTRGVDKVDNSHLDFVDGGDREKKVDIPEYESAGSSFSRSPDPSDSNQNIDGGISSVVDESQGDSFAHKTQLASMNTSGLQGNECGKEEDNLVGVSNSEEVETNSRSEFEPKNQVTRERKTNKDSQKIKNNETKMVQERLRFAGQSSVSNLTNEEEDEDDCLVIKRKMVAKAAGKRIGKREGPSNFSSPIDLSDDDTNGSVVEDEGSIVLAGPRSTFKLSSKISKMLYPHQRDGLKWLWSLHCMGKGGILGDDMGLGKTMQICGYLAGLFDSRLIKRAMIVAPKTLLSHWIKELTTVGLSRDTREYFGTSLKAREYELQFILQNKGILLTTYDIVRNNSKSLRGDCYFSEDSEDDYIWDYMILDEGHLIKNPSTQRSKSLLEIPSAHRIIISGTPIQNNLKELWTLFNFSCPNLLGDYRWFKENYEHAILRGNEKNASARQKYTGSTVAKELRERIQPYFLRRLKNEVFKEDDSTTATLSKKNEMIVWLRLTSCQRQLYEAFLQSELVLSAFDDSPLAALTILKKICDHPLLLTKRAAEEVLEGMDSILNPEDSGIAEKLALHVADAAERAEFQEKHANISCKISFIMSLLDDLIPKGHNVLIFSQTCKMLNLIQESLESSGYEYLRIDGTVKAADRVKIVDDFQKGVGAPIFLLTSQVGGLGLTLTKADRVIVVDPAWNPSTDNQSVDRAYRIGQQKDVIVYRLMTCGTVEEKIYRKQIYKGGLFKTATEHKEQIRYFSQQDLRELFSLPKQGFDISLTQQQLHEEHDHQFKMDESLETNVKFLETLGIAGVSHHSLLFSKTAPVEAVDIEEEEIRRKQTTFVGNSSRTTLERNVDGAGHAFNPKDVKLNQKNASPDSVGKLTESDIKERLNRLSQLLGNKATVSRLPDQGAKLQKQISELNLELNKIKMDKTTRNEVIDLDDLTEDLQRVLNV